MLDNPWTSSSLWRFIKTMFSFKKFERKCNEKKIKIKIFKNKFKISKLF